jgi:hypothetical protein
MRRLAFASLAPTALVLATGCTDATGSVQGGQALTFVSDAGPCNTWSALYAAYFGPTGQASCAPSSQSSCHGDASQLGAQTSGFVCGSTKDTCWQGMTQGIPPDAGGFFPAILPPDGGDATQSQLYVSIHKSSSASGLNNMPCGDQPICHAGTATYTFTDTDLACITAWAQGGAPNN